MKISTVLEQGNFFPDKIQARWKTFSHSTHTEMAHLAIAGANRPELLNNVVQELFINKQQKYNVLSSLLSKTKKVLKEDSYSVEWALSGGRLKPAVVLENVHPESDLTPGKFSRKVRIKLDRSWYQTGDVLTPRISNDKKYQLRVDGFPAPHGTGFVYECTLNDDINHIPVKYLTSGVEWTKLYAQFEEGREQAGSTQYGSVPFKLSAGLSRMAKEYRVTGDAATKVFEMDVPFFHEGKQVMMRTWVRYQEYVFMQQWAQEIENNLWFSRENKGGLVGSTGRLIHASAGIFQQLENAEKVPFIDLTVELLNQVVIDLYYGKMVGPERNLILQTGEYGMLAFHKAVTQFVNGSGQPWALVSSSDSSPVYKTNSDWAKNNAFGFGYRFNEYQMPTGGTIKVIHNSVFDNPEHFSAKHNGTPIQSMAFVAFDASDQGTSLGLGDNVMMVERGNSFKSSYVCGLHSPVGPITPQKPNGFTAQHKGDYYEMFCQYDCAVIMKDPTKVLYMYWDVEATNF